MDMDWMDWLQRRIESLLDNAIFAGIIAVIVVVWSVIKKLPGPEIFVLGLAVFAVILWIFATIRGKLLEKKNKSEQIFKPGISISNCSATGNINAGKESSNVGGFIGGIHTGLSRQDQALLDSYKRLASYDGFHLRDLMLVRNEKLLSPNFDPVMGGQLQFAFEVFNGSILPTVKVGYSIDGNLMFQSRQFHDKTEIQTPSIIHHGQWGTIVIKQRVLPEVVKEIREGASKAAGIILDFGFQDVHVYAEENGGNQPLNTQNILDIVKTMKFRVKHEAGIYFWQRL